MTTTSDWTDEKGGRLPWEIHEITAPKSLPGDVRFCGTNHFFEEGTCARDFGWCFNQWAFKDPEFYAQRYDFRGATIDPVARERLRGLTRAWLPEQIAAVAGLAALLEGGA